MTPPPDDAIDLIDWFFQVTHQGFNALDALAAGDMPNDWTEAAEGLAATQDVLRESPPRLHGLVVSDDDVAALARLRALVAAGTLGDEARALASRVRASFGNKAFPARSA